MSKFDGGKEFYQIHLHLGADAQLTVLRTEAVLTSFQTTNSSINSE